MSSRQLRKLQQQKELELSVAHELDDSDGVEGPPSPIRAKPRVSLFAALGSDEGGDDDDDADEAPLDDDIETATKTQDMASPQPTVLSKKSKKKKKKKKAKAKAADAPSGEPADDDEEAEDEIDKAVKELNIKPRRQDESPNTAQGSPLLSKMNELLKVNPYHLKAINEMRNLFGREVIESTNAEDQQEHGRRRRDGQPQHVDLETFLREPPGAKRLPEVSLRRNVFVQGREHWPRQTAGGLTMIEVQKLADSTEYAYIHEGEYDGIQAFFFACVQIGDPMRMVHLLKRAPYHVSTLLQVSSVAKQDQNMALAAELCERALFTFGRVTTSAFRQNIEHGRARLDFRRPENRQFWLAGYHYLKSLVRKGTYRTALEWAKLLYGLNLEDPYSMRHYIHFLAIRAYESKWLIEFLDEMDKAGEKQDSIYLSQTVVLAKLQVGDVDGAREALARGIRQLPWLYCSLFQELNLDTPPSIWGISPHSDARKFWVALYIYQTKDLWNNAQATALLQAVAKGLDKVDTSSLPADDLPADLGTTRLVYLEGQTSLLAVAPRQLLDRQPNYEFDPLPPDEEENIFTSEGTQLPWREREAQNSEQTNNARFHNMLNRLVAAAGPGAGAAAGAGVDEVDPEEQAVLDADDEELMRDIEAHAGGRGGPGMLGQLMRMMGLGGSGGEGQHSDENEDDEAPPEDR